MASYRPIDFWEKSHASVAPPGVNLGLGIHHVGGGQSLAEAEMLYRLRRLNANRVLAKSRLPRNPAIFELGCGGGYWVEFFRKLEPRLFVGSDLSSTAIERLSSRYLDYQFILMRVPEEAWPQIRTLGPYDLSIAIDVLYHITDDTIWEGTLKRLCSNTGASGLVLIADYFYEQPIGRASVAHVKFRPMQAYLDILDRCGFVTEQVQPVFYFMNRTISGPWRDHNKLFSPILRLLTSNWASLQVVGILDAVITAFARPMNPQCKTRFLLARKASGA